MARQGRYLPDWTIGTLTLVAGELDFTTADSLLVTAEIQPGDTIITASGLTLPIAEITGENAGKLAYACPAAAAGVDQPLRIRYQSESSRYTGMAASLFKMLGGGNLFSLGELEGAEGEYLRFLAPGVLEAVAGGNLEAFRAIELVKNKLLGVNNDGELSMMPIQNAVVYDTAQELTAAERGRARANIDTGILAGFRNKIINGDFDIWQRGTAFSASGYTADRWAIYAGAGSTFSAVKAAYRVGVDAINLVRSTTGTGSLQLYQRIEGVNTLAGRRVTVTFNAVKVGSTGGAALPVDVSIAQYFGTGGSAGVNLPAKRVTVQATAEKFSLVFDLPSVEGKTVGAGSYITLVLAVPDTAGNFSGLYISHVSLVEGDATAEVDPFSPRHIQQELALGQRYFQTFATGGSWFGGTTCYGDLKLRHVFGLPTRMRVPPSITRTNAAGSIFWNGGWLDVTVVMQPLNDFTVQVVFDVPGWTGVPESPGILSRLTNLNETLPVSFQLSSEL
ncbi:hypothetical protein [Brucella intermedia]|uniref:hypothetical protein n=1 Tax=Brucella intermedia TaxID=94625 RepID=UPI00235F8BC5|nr:hypothetical protein [Brucella intermedia]